MATSSTIQLIQDNSNARATYFHWVAGSAILTSLTGVAMPVGLYRGHSLVKTIALGALVNGIAWGGVVAWGKRCEGYLSQWVEALNGELLQGTDPQIASYLARFPEAYEVVDIDPNVVTAADLKRVWQRSYMSGEETSRLAGAIQTGWVAFAIGSVLLFGSALVGRLVQEPRPWQRWMAMIPFAVASAGSAAALWAGKGCAQRGIDTLYIEHTLGRVIIAESLSNTLSPELSQLAANETVWIRLFYTTQQLGSDKLEQANGLISPHGRYVRQDRQGDVSFDRS